ncbi:hypothetical protein V6R21_10250 [Limibacter armeniacum]|uniref:hypothetical protein n=1 Tax=Limibacter armeniacum TaxID=466084 RepID=UPI002FE5384E
MRNNLIILLIGLLFFQCQEVKKGEVEDAGVIEESIDFDTTNIVESNTNLPTPEVLIDSLKIAKSGEYKIILKQIRTPDSVYVEFELYKKENLGWKHLQYFSIEKDGITSLDAEFIDFNNDNYNDLTFKRGVAARGANELRSLFVFDKEKEKLIHITNSNNYPNLRYNAELDCIDAWLIYGGSSTVFLKLEADTLREFAGVSLLDTRDVYTLDRNGNKKMLSQDVIKDSVVYRRYSNYNPLKVNEEYE